MAAGLVRQSTAVDGRGGATLVPFGESPVRCETPGIRQAHAKEFRLAKGATMYRRVTYSLLAEVQAAVPAFRAERTRRIGEQNAKIPT
jgi:hypothetical protein